jgi:hypothetical protein
MLTSPSPAARLRTRPPASVAGLRCWPTATVSHHGVGHQLDLSGRVDSGFWSHGWSGGLSTTGRTIVLRSQLSSRRGRSLEWSATAAAGCRSRAPMRRRSAWPETHSDLAHQALARRTSPPCTTFARSAGEHDARRRRTHRARAVRSQRIQRHDDGGRVEALDVGRSSAILRPRPTSLGRLRPRLTDHWRRDAWDLDCGVRSLVSNPETGFDDNLAEVYGLLCERTAVDRC